MRKVFYTVIFILLFLLSIFPRGIELVNHNYIFLFDQGREYLAAKNIVINHKFILIGTELGAGSAGISGIFHGPIYYYLLTIPFILFRGDPYGGVVLMFLLSLSAIIAGFFLARKIWGFWWGVIAAFLFAISPPLISQARFIWSPNPPTVFIVLAFYFMYRYIKEKRLWMMFWAAFFSGFVYNFEFALAIPMVLTLMLYTIVLKQKEIRFYLALIGGIIVAFLPMIFFEVRHNFLAIHGVLSYIFVHKVDAKVHTSFLSTLNSHWGAFFTNTADTFPHMAFLPGIFVLMTLLILSMWYLFQEKEKAVKFFVGYMLLLLPITIFVFGFLRNFVYHYYLTDLNIVYIFLFLFIAYESLKKKEKVVFAVFGLYFLLLVITASINAVWTWNHDINDYGGVSKIKGIEQALDYIYKDGKGKQFGVLVFAPPVYTYQYDYMIWWYGERKYHYVPYQEKKGLVYLLIELDPAKPWSYKGWLETVIKTGTIIKTTQLFPSGFIIQERQFSD